MSDPTDSSRLRVNQCKLQLLANKKGLINEGLLISNTLAAWSKTAEKEKSYLKSEIGTDT